MTKVYIGSGDHIRTGHLIEVDFDRDNQCYSFSIDDHGISSFKTFSSSTPVEEVQQEFYKLVGNSGLWVGLPEDRTLVIPVR